MERMRILFTRRTPTHAESIDALVKKCKMESANLSKTMELCVASKLAGVGVGVDWVELPVVSAEKIKQVSKVSFFARMGYGSHHEHSFTTQQQKYAECVSKVMSLHLPIGAMSVGMQNEQIVQNVERQFLDSKQAIQTDTIIDNMRHNTKLSKSKLHNTKLSKSKLLVLNNFLIGIKKCAVNMSLDIKYLQALYETKQNIDDMSLQGYNKNKKQLQVLWQEVQRCIQAGGDLSHMTLELPVNLPIDSELALHSLKGHAYLIRSKNAEKECFLGLQDKCIAILRDPNVDTTCTNLKLDEVQNWEYNILYMSLIERGLIEILGKSVVDNLQKEILVKLIAEEHDTPVHETGDKQIALLENMLKVLEKELAVVHVEDPLLGIQKNLLDASVEVYAEYQELIMQYQEAHTKLQHGGA